MDVNKVDVLRTTERGVTAEHMEEKLDKLISVVYRKWREKQGKGVSSHPDEETMALFIEDKLVPAENSEVQEHVSSCRQCAEALAAFVRSAGEEHEVDPALTGKVKNSIAQEMGNYFLEIMLRGRDRMLEILHTTGDVLVGQEFVPAAVLRGRSIKDFKDEVIILKDFRDIRVEIKLESRDGDLFDVTVVVKDKNTQALIKDARVALLREGAELESYVSDPGKVSFERVAPGAYSIEVMYTGEKSAVIVLNITG